MIIYKSIRMLKDQILENIILDEISSEEDVNTLMDIDKPLINTTEVLQMIQRFENGFILCSQKYIQSYQVFLILFLQSLSIRIHMKILLKLILISLIHYFLINIHILGKPLKTLHLSTFTKFGEFFCVKI